MDEQNWKAQMDAASWARSMLFLGLLLCSLESSCLEFLQEHCSFPVVAAKLARRREVHDVLDTKACGKRSKTSTAGQH